MEEKRAKVALDPFQVVGNALALARKTRVPEKIIFVDYDDVADVLYVKFKQGRMVDSDPLDDCGLVMATLDSHGEVIGLIILEASKFTALLGT